MRQPRLLDLFCGAGGAGMGYIQAGWDVIGVDINDQPRYPGEFIRADVRTLTAKAIADLDVIAVHASPPCQRFSRLVSYQRATIADRYDDLVNDTRTLLLATGLPYVIENVPRAPLTDPIELCGCMFPEVGVYRERWIETNWPLPQPAHEPHVETCARNGYLPAPGQRMTVTGGKHSIAWQRAACEAMGTPWMAAQSGRDRALAIREVCEAVPPPYFEWVGHRLRTHLAQRLASERAA